MKRVEIMEDFSGYPNGKDERAFHTGETPEFSNEFADLVVGRGHAREAKASAAKKDVME